MHRVIRKPVMKFHYCAALVRLLLITAMSFYNRNSIILYDLLLEFWESESDDEPEIEEEVEDEINFYFGYSISAIRLLVHCTKACIVTKKLY